MLRRIFCACVLLFCVTGCSSSVPGEAKGTYEGNTAGSIIERSEDHLGETANVFESSLIISEKDGRPYATLRYLAYECPLELEKVEDETYRFVEPAICSVNLGACSASATLERSELKLANDTATLEGEGSYLGCGALGTFEGTFTGVLRGS